MNPRLRHPAHWLALIGITLFTLWPLLATVQPRGEGAHYELCPHAAMHRMAEANGREPPSSNPLWHTFQLQCVFSLNSGDGVSVVPAPTVAVVVDQQIDRIIFASGRHASIPPNRFYATAPRGPPAVS